MPTSGTVMRNEIGVEKCATVVLAAIVLFLASLPALALGDAARRTLWEGSVTAGPVIAIAIAFFSRRQPIGSWLLCYYVQLYSAIALNIWIFAVGFQNLAPSAWDSTSRYVMFLVSVIPLQIARVIEVVLGTRLLLRRTQQRLRDFRWALIAMLVASGISVGIDAYFFPVAQKLFVDALALGFSTIWLAYFYRARRVRLVFIEGMWNRVVSASSQTSSRAADPESTNRLINERPER